MILTVVPLAPSRASSSAVDPNLPAIGAVKRVAADALSNWSHRPAVQRLGALATVRVEALEHVEEAEEDRDLEEHRKAAHERVGLFLPVELHHLLLERLPVTLVLLLQLLHLGLERLHRPLRLDLLDEDREQDHPDGDHQEEDRQDPGPVGAEDRGGRNPDGVPDRMPGQQDPRNRVVDPVETQFSGSSHVGSSAAARLRHRVVSTRVKWVAARQPPDRQRGPPERTVPRHRLQGVRAARRVEPTAGRQRRTYPPTVRDDGQGQRPGTGGSRSGRHRLAAHRVAVLGRVRAAASAASRSAPSRVIGGVRRGGQGAYHEGAAGRQVVEPLPDQVP